MLKRDVSRAYANSSVRKSLGTGRAYVAKHNGKAALWLRNHDRALADHGGPLLLATGADYRELLQKARDRVLFERDSVDAAARAEAAPVILVDEWASLSPDLRKAVEQMIG